MLYKNQEKIELIDIEAPEFIASSLHLLSKNGWKIENFNYERLSAVKNINQSENCILNINIRNTSADITCETNFDIETPKNELNNFIISYTEFLSSNDFEEQITELKYHYFMDNPIEYDDFAVKNSEKSSRKKLFGFYKGHPVTSVIILLNFLVFVIMVVSGVSLMMPETEEILKWGGNFRPLILEGEWWRLLSCCFIHIGIIHILFNMWALYNIGIVIEPMIGSFRFGFAYIICGLAGSLNSIVWHYATPSAGASGAIFGMFGLFAALLTTNLLEKGFRSAMLKSIMPMIVLNLILGTSAMIDNAGHIGGLLTGVLFGYLIAWRFKFPKSTIVNIILFAIPILLLASSVFAINKYLPNPYKEYKNLLANINKYEISALELEKNQQNQNSLKQADLLWDKAIKDATELQNLKLDKNTEVVNERLLYYLKLRKKELNYLNQPEDYDKLRNTSQSIDSILKIINEK
ncbi:MAG: rhomboid family intramembrane serine protease [Bacteroidetes bacterium]|nr:rhomboid family intramembrane serine protease [Bacteroidota bacterium]